jgi:hypothetical protein
VFSKAAWILSMKRPARQEFNIFLLLTLAALAASGCHVPPSPPPQPTVIASPAIPTPAGISLRFSTIHQDDDSTWPWYKGEPRLFVAPNTEDLAPFLEYLPEQVRAQLSAIDFDQSFVLAVFRGLVPTHDYRVSILDIRVRQNIVLVTASSERPTGEVETESTSPYHIARVERDLIDWKTGPTFVLYLDGVQVQRSSL